MRVLLVSNARHAISTLGGVPTSTQGIYYGCLLCYCTTWTRVCMDLRFKYTLSSLQSIKDSSGSLCDVCLNDSSHENVISRLGPRLKPDFIGAGQLPDRMGRRMSLCWANRFGSRQFSQYVSIHCPILRSQVTYQSVIYGQIMITMHREFVLANSIKLCRYFLYGKQESSLLWLHSR